MNNAEISKILFENEELKARLSEANREAEFGKNKGAVMDVNDWGQVSGRSNDTLRASLAAAEKRNEELKLALEAARNQLGEAQFKLNHLSIYNGGLIDERDKAKDELEVARREAKAVAMDCQEDAKKYRAIVDDYNEAAEGRARAERDRDAARADAARLRELIENLAPEDGLWQQHSNGGDTCVWCGDMSCKAGCPWFESRLCLATPGPTIGEIKAEAVENFARKMIELYSNYEPAKTIFSEARAEAARHRGGGK